MDNNTATNITPATTYCTGCHCFKPTELFAGRQRQYKTCKTCRNRRSDVGKPIADDLLITLEEALEMIPSRYDDDEITETNREDASIDYSITAYIRLDQEMLDMDDQHLVTHIRTSIEARDGYHYYHYFMAATHLKFGSTFICCCSQSSESQRQVPDNRRRRIHTRMETFSCNGYINGMIDRPNSYVRITIEHSTGHRAAPSATNNNVDRELITYISEKCITMSAQDLYLDILTVYPNTMGTLTQAQVYYWWNKSFESQYKLHRNQFTSTEMHLDRAAARGVEKVSHLYTIVPWDISFETVYGETDMILGRTCQQYSTLGFTMPLFRVICEMAEVEEFHVDSTYKTNRTGHELFSIVASVNGIGFPIAYFLLRMNPINEPINSNDQSDPTNHTIASTDHTTTINTSNSPTPNIDNTPTTYAPTAEEIQEATRSQLIAGFFTRLRSRGLNPRFMFTDKDEGQIDAISQVFGDNAVRLCLWHIMRAVKLQLAKPKLSNPQYNINEADAWAYLYSRWYRDSWWNKWARSTRVPIPIGKTTMMIESQWRILKRDFLINSNRPRLDFLVWIIIQKQLVKVHHNFMLKVVNRAEKLEWELEFVREWHVKTGHSDPGSNSRGTRAENPDADQLYLPSLENWTCGCPSFATSRFMLCKHLISRYRNSTPLLRNVFGAHDYFICRQSIAPYNHIYPFSLVILPEGRLEVPQTTTRPTRLVSPQIRPITTPNPPIPSSPASVSNNEEEEEGEREDIIVNDQWQQQIEAEESIANLQEALANIQQALGGAYNNYRGLLDQHQRDVFDRSVRDNNINDYFHHVRRYRERRRRDRTWRDDNPYTRYL
ncbi:hypothetical protein INT45_011563 [Circinella minor]|uniref:SWIM-type domain-containing protein n=1 Tax=Circinella minor TaxID=1195481 RepID=A0A8H7RR78_9FUNG|nr:hypothetical protein INT45_011563 [Circinella minor]